MSEMAEELEIRRQSSVFVYFLFGFFYLGWSSDFAATVMVIAMKRVLVMKILPL